MAELNLDIILGGNARRELRALVREIEDTPEQEIDVLLRPNEERLQEVLRAAGQGIDISVNLDVSSAENRIEGLSQDLAEGMRADVRLDVSAAERAIAGLGSRLERELRQQARVSLDADVNVSVQQGAGVVPGRPIQPQGGKGGKGGKGGQSFLPPGVVDFDPNDFSPEALDYLDDLNAQDAAFGVWPYVSRGAQWAGSLFTRARAVVNEARSFRELDPERTSWLGSLWYAARGSARGAVGAETGRRVGGRVLGWGLGTGVPLGFAGYAFWPWGDDGASQAEEVYDEATRGFTGTVQGPAAFVGGLDAGESQLARALGLDPSVAANRGLIRNLTENYAGATGADRGRATEILRLIAGSRSRSAFTGAVGLFRGIEALQLSIEGEDGTAAGVSDRLKDIFRDPNGLESILEERVPSHVSALYLGENVDAEVRRRLSLDRLADIPETAYAKQVREQVQAERVAQFFGTAGYGQDLVTDYANPGLQLARRLRSASVGASLAAQEYLGRLFISPDALPEASEILSRFVELGVDKRLSGDLAQLVESFRDPEERERLRAEVDTQAKTFAAQAKFLTGGDLFNEVVGQQEYSQSVRTAVGIEHQADLFERSIERGGRRSGYLDYLEREGVDPVSVLERAYEHVSLAAKAEFDDAGQAGLQLDPSRIDDFVQALDEEIDRLYSGRLELAEQIVAGRGSGGGSGGGFSRGDASYVPGEGGATWTGVGGAVHYGYWSRGGQWDIAGRRASIQRRLNRAAEIPDEWPYEPGQWDLRLQQIFSELGYQTNATRSFAEFRDRAVPRAGGIIASGLVQDRLAQVGGVWGGPVGAGVGFVAGSVAERLLGEAVDLLGGIEENTQPVLAADRAYVGPLYVGPNPRGDDAPPVRGEGGVPYTDPSRIESGHGAAGKIVVQNVFRDFVGDPSQIARVVTPAVIKGLERAERRGSVSLRRPPERPTGR